MSDSSALSVFAQGHLDNQGGTGLMKHERDLEPKREKERNEPKCSEWRPLLILAP